MRCGESCAAFWPHRLSFISGAQQTLSAGFWVDCRSLQNLREELGNEGRKHHEEHRILLIYGGKG